MRRVAYVMLGGLVGTGPAATGVAQGPTGGTGAMRPLTCTTSDCHAHVTERELVHEPVAVNRCDACHVPKRGATAFRPGARHEFKRAGDDPELCYACHDRLGNAHFVHEPVKMGVCILCHDPHGAEHASLLRVDIDRQLCARCHRVTVDQGLHVHPPVGDGACGACHDPHGSDQAKFLRAAPEALCLDCHDTIEEMLEDATVAHGPVTTGRSCLSCHDPHASDAERLLLREPMGLCLSCHDKRLDSNGGSIRNIAEYLEGHPDHHGPIKDGNCTACHNPHGGAIRRLLTEAYPAGPYAPFDEETYALCFGCHDFEMVEEARDDEVTEFRNGDLNLHYVHVNRADKGCTCGVCHDPHAGSGPKHIADPMAFGVEARLTKYRATATGGSCVSSCHATLAYDRVQPVKHE